MEEHCLYSSTDLTLTSMLGTDAEAIFDGAFLAAYGAGDFSDYDFMERGFSENRLASFEQTVPIRIYHGSDDQVVLPEDTRTWVESFNAAGMEVELIEVPGGTHEDVAFGYLATPQSHTLDSIDWLKAQLDGSGIP
jgi:acetyl esterase/lipase